MEKLKIKNLFLNYWPILFLFFVWFLFSSPFFLKNKVPYSSTYQVNFFAPWSAYQQFASPIKNNAMPDVTTQIYPWKKLVIQTYKQGELPLWNPYSFGGTPLLANVQSAVLSPINILYFLFPFVDGWSLSVLAQPLLAGLFMYLFIRKNNISKISSLISAISFMFCGFLTVWMSYATLGYAMLFIPLALYAIIAYVASLQYRFLFLLSLTVPLSFFSGHTQTSTYFLLVVFAYAIFKSFHNKKVLFVLFIFIGLGLLLSMPQLLPAIQFYQLSVRSGIFEKGEVIPWQYLATLFAPDFFGNPVTRNDWFGHYAEWHAYIGMIPLFLSLFALLNKKQKDIWFFVVIGLLALLFALPTPLIDGLIALHIPILSTSAASRIIVIFSFAFCVLSGFGLDQLIGDINHNKKKPFLIISSFFVFLFLTLALAAKIPFFLPIDKAHIASQNLMLPLFLFIVAIVVIGLGFSLAKKKIIMPLVLGALLVIVTLEMLRFATKWQPFDPKQLVFPEVGVTKFFAMIGGHERALGNYGAETAVYYHLPSLEGYDPLYPARFGEFIQALYDGKVKQPQRSVVTFQKTGKYINTAIDLLNVKYIVHKTSDDFTGWTFPYWDNPNQFRLLFEDSSYRVYENKAAFPHAFFVSSYTVETNPQKIIDTMFHPHFDLRNDIVLEKDPKLHVSENAKGIVQIVSYRPDAISMKVMTNGDGFIFLSDNYYPGWDAYIDGHQVQIYRADYTFRAIAVTKGLHNVEFVYKPDMFILGIYLAGAGLLGLGIIFVKRKKY